MSKRSSVACFVILGIGLAGAYALIAWTKANTADTATALSNYVAEQNNLWPNGKFTNVGTKMATPRKTLDSGYPSDSWRQGGESSTTFSTGTFAK